MILKSCATFILLVSIAGTASAAVHNHGIEVFSDSTVKAGVVEKKKAAVKIFPNPSTNGTVRVVSNTAGSLNFYIFDLDGTLLHQAVIKEKEKHTISNLKKGVYIYDAFYNDEGIEHGKLIVK